MRAVRVWATDEAAMTQAQHSGLPLVVITFDERLVAMNAHTGQRVWECPTEMSTVGRLFVDQGLVIYACDRTVYCVDYKTGALRWKVDDTVVVAGTVLVFAGCILLTSGGETACLNAQNGNLLWHDKFKGYGVGGGAMAAPGVAAQIDRHR
jgi:outer membrane protein assembly factor BamB